MTKGKRKRIRERVPAPAPAGRAVTRRSPAPATRRAHVAPTQPTRTPTPVTARTAAAPATADVQQPPVAVSLVRGLATFGRSPVMLAVVFGGALALWLAYSISGVVHFASPGVMAQLESAPPVHALLDIEYVLTASRALSPGVVATLAAVVLLLRSALVAFSIAFALEALTTDAGDRSRARAALRRIPAALPGVLALEVGFLAAVYVLARAFALVLGPSGPLLGVIVPAYLFIYAPIVLVAERATVAASVRTAVRAARVPGRSHVVLTLLYPMVSIVLISLTTGGLAVPVTPSIVVWCYALFMSFVHGSVLAAFAYRWLLIRAPALDTTTPRRPRRWWTLAPR